MANVSAPAAAPVSGMRFMPWVFAFLSVLILALVGSAMMGASISDVLGHDSAAHHFLAENLAPVMFASMVIFLLLGYPVAFALAANGIVFGLLGIDLGLLQPSLFNAMPDRIWGVMNNDTLLAIPFFTFMGLVLERSGMAEDLLDTVGQIFGPIRGGIAYAVILVGAMLAATTGVVAASVISMGLISMPIMLRYGYDRRLASGVIAASGTLAQIIPPSLVLIVMADQLGRSVGDLYKGAFIPGFILTALYAVYVFACTMFRPESAPALPPEARSLRESNGASGNRSLGVLTLIAVAAGVLFAKQYPESHPLDETIVVSIMVGIGVAFVLALINRQFKLGLLSQIAEKTTFVLIPPLGLIFLVLGTIFVGIATPTEGGAMGATGAIIMALSRKRLDLALLKQAMYSTAKLTTFVLFILVGARVFSLTFYGVDGHVWVEHLLHDLPGGQIGFLIVVNLLVFGLAFFLDFFELAFIVVPLLAPVAEKLGIDLVWFGVLLAVNMQTSFMHPPFGFALFYLRSVAATKDYTDKVTGKLIERVKSSQIYWGAVPFVLIQLSMVAMLIAFPNLVTMGLDKAVDTSGAELTQELQITPDANDDALPPPVMEGEAPAAPAAGEEPTPAFNASDFAGDGKDAGKP